MELIFSRNFQYTLGGVQKLYLQELSSFDHLPPSVYIFYGIKFYKKLIFFDHLPPSSCKRSLWTTPNLKYSHVISGFTVHRLVNWRGHKASTLVGGFQGKQDGYHCTAAAPHRVPGDTILFKKSKSRLWLNNKEHVQNQKITWNLS